MIERRINNTLSLRSAHKLSPFCGINALIVPFDYSEDVRPLIEQKIKHFLDVENQRLKSAKRINYPLLIRGRINCPLVPDFLRINYPLLIRLLKYILSP